MINAQARPNPSVPASAAEITAAWLGKALSTSEIKQLELEAIGEGFGLASHLFRVRWHEGGCGRSVVVKLWDTSGVAGTREVFFYHTFGQAIGAGARIPICFHAAVDPTRQRGVLVLEDLDAAVQGDFLHQLNAELATPIAKSLASIHATWMQHPALNEAQWLPSLARWERDESWFAPRRTRFLARFGDRLTPLAHALLDQIEQAPPIVNERLAEAPLTLLHTDFHLDNIIFMAGMQPVILDWANCAKGPAVHDLFDLLFGICQPDAIEPVLAVYLTTFAERSANWQDPMLVHQQLAAVFLRKFATATCGIANWQPASPREVALIDTTIERILFAADYWLAREPKLFSLFSSL